MVTWLESIKNDVDGGLSITWKTYSLEQEKLEDNSDTRVWEDPDYDARGVKALVASKAARRQGEEAFLDFHLSIFKAKFDHARDISDTNVLKDIAKEAGLDVDRFTKDMADRKSWRGVGTDHMEAKEEYQIFGLPTVVFPDQRPLFIKLRSVPESKRDRVELFNNVFQMAVREPYLLELKRP